MCGTFIHIDNIKWCMVLVQQQKKTLTHRSFQLIIFFYLHSSENILRYIFSVNWWRSRKKRRPPFICLASWMLLAWHKTSRRMICNFVNALAFLWIHRFYLSTHLAVRYIDLIIIGWLNLVAAWLFMLSCVLLMFIGLVWNEFGGIWNWN